MRVNSNKRSSRKQAARFRRKMAERTVNEQVKSYNRLVEAGISLVKYWSLAAVIIPDHIKILSALLAFVDASYFSDKPRQAKTDAVGLALRAAYIFGKFNGEPPEPETTETAANEEAEENPADGHTDE